MKVYHHYLRKKRINGYGQEARQTVGQGEAKVDDQTCAGDSSENGCLQVPHYRGNYRKQCPKVDGFSRKMVLEFQIRNRKVSDKGKLSAKPKSQD